MLDGSTAAVVVAALFGVVGAAVARRVRPSLGVWMMTIGGSVAAVCGALVLALLALPLVAQSPEIAEAGHWSVRALDRHDPTNDGVATTALVLLCVVTARAVWVFFSRMTSTRSAARACRELGPDADGIVVVQGDDVDAFAIAGHPGRIVVTTAAMARLPLEQRRALLAHEREHLVNRHHAHLTATQVAIALNPLLRPLASAQAFCVERAADEAAAATTDRLTVALTLEHVARLARSEDCPNVAALKAAGTAVEQRRAALARPAPGRRPALTLLFASVLAVVVLTTGNAWANTMVVFKLSRTIAHATLEIHPRGSLPTGAR